MLEKYNGLVKMIKDLFTTYDEDGTGTLDTRELGLVVKGLDLDISDEELERCAIEIDTDGNGTISFDEFAVWFIGGKEGSPDIGDKLQGYLSMSSKYSNELISILSDQLKKL